MPARGWYDLVDPAMEESSNNQGSGKEGRPSNVHRLPPLKGVKMTMIQRYIEMCLYCKTALVSDRLFAKEEACALCHRRKAQILLLLPRDVLRDLLSDDEFHGRPLTLESQEHVTEGG